MRMPYTAPQVSHLALTRPRTATTSATCPATGRRQAGRQQQHGDHKACRRCRPVTADDPKTAVRHLAQVPCDSRITSTVRHHASEMLCRKADAPDGPHQLDALSGKWGPTITRPHQHGHDLRHSWARRPGWCQYCPRGASPRRGLPRDTRCEAAVPELGPRQRSDGVIRRPHLRRDVMTGSKP